MITTHRLPPKATTTTHASTVGAEPGLPDPYPAIVPVTIQVERNLRQRPELVFDAYADVDQRVRWRASSDEPVVFQSHDFRVGGTDHFVRGLPGSPSCAGTTCYEHIATNERIVFTERFVDSGDQLLAISVVTWTIAPSGTGALLIITDQTTSVVGSGPIEGSRYAYQVMLDRLARHLADRVG
ncbi:MAG: SRPBCC domain-containing protein [Acidimicrobiia bacterium]|nr:SRPBCC domain-containing protein [Acidimicrobiia bacterium]